MVCKLEEAICKNKVRLRPHNLLAIPKPWGCLYTPVKRAVIQRKYCVSVELIKRNRNSFSASQREETFQVEQVRESWQQPKQGQKEDLVRKVKYCWSRR